MRKVLAILVLLLFVGGMASISEGARTQRGQKVIGQKGHHGGIKAAKPGSKQGRLFNSKRAELK